MTTSLRSLAFALTLAACACLPSSRSARAQEVSPVPAPTIINSAPYTISTPGYYQLGANLSYAGNGSANDAIITINASNVTLDLGGHYLSGPVNTPATGLYGVYADGRANLIIQNGTIANCYAGVRLGSDTANTNNRNPVVRNMVFTACYFAGTYVQNYTGFLFTNNRVSGIGGTTFGTFAGYAVGVFTNNCSGCNVSNNIISNVTATQNDYGIVRGGNGDLTALGNTISNVSTSTQGNTAAGISAATVAIGNVIQNAKIGLVDSGKYKDNVTFNVTTPFSGGTDAGGNN